MASRYLNGDGVKQLVTDIYNKVHTKLSQLDNTAEDANKVLTANGDGTTSWKDSKGALWTDKKEEYDPDEVKDGTTVIFTDDTDELPTYVNPDDFDFTNGVLGLNPNVTAKLDEVDNQKSDGYLGTKNKSYIGCFAQGSISANGECVASITNGCVTNYIEVEPNEYYTLSFNREIGTARINFYTADKTHIERRTASFVSKMTEIVPSNAKYMRWSFSDQGSTIDEAYCENLQIQLEKGQERTEFEENSGLSNRELTKEIAQLSDMFSPTDLISSGLNFTDCTYVTGGYCRIGRFVYINIAIQTTKTSGRVYVNGLPSAKLNTPLSTMKTSDPNSSPTQNTAFVNQSGQLNFILNGSQGTFAINGMYATN